MLVSCLVCFCFKLTEMLECHPVGWSLDSGDQVLTLGISNLPTVASCIEMVSLLDAFIKTLLDTQVKQPVATKKTPLPTLRDKGISIMNTRRGTENPAPLV
jgi:hypothetical protein